MIVHAERLSQRHHSRKNINKKTITIISRRTDTIDTLRETGKRVFPVTCLPLTRYIEKLSLVMPSQYDKNLFALSFSVTSVRIV